MKPLAVTGIIGPYDPAGAVGKTTDWVDIDIDLCEKLRWKKETVNGRLLVVDLPRFSHIGHHDVLYDDGRHQIVARMLPVPVWVMEPSDMEGMGSLCYHIGNLHQPCLVEGPCVMTPADASLEALAQSLGVPCRQEERILPRGFSTRNRSAHRHDL